MKKRFKNKRAIEKVMSIFWFSVLIIVAFGVFVMVYNFYNHPYDVREIEADLLTNKVMDCLSTSGKLNFYVFEENFADNFLEECDISFKVENENNWKENSEYYVGIKIYNSSGLDLEIEKGNKNLISSCIDEDLKIEDKRLAVCSEREFLSLKGEETYSIKILSIVRKTEKNVRY